ncbi:hypothetical protein PROFUN_01526 [Planoprotostelium fungivorum]|uniref:SAM domain-containing protein n=1 Tax=Planoprotostelium fungivorum TaxID=1890364 RepID=A0A2P6NTI1_9EUKA|nr:hypothetical protein PROFUN_01526 [Planoprotostelium fungivorum]
MASIKDLLQYLVQFDPERWSSLSVVLSNEGITTIQDMIGLGENDMNILGFNMGEKIRFRRYQVEQLLKRIANLDITPQQYNPAIRQLNQNSHLVPHWAMLDDEELTYLVLAHA